MFPQNDGEKKLDWMYKGPNSMVDREEYLLGRSVDKTLEQINAEEKQQQQQAYLAPPKNHVEHECIPPSIRDFNKIILAEQVDISAKLQEDPLVAIKKHEEEVRRQFLQNPVQLKKLQDALEAQKNKSDKHRSKKKKSKKKRHRKNGDGGSSDDSSDNLDTQITKKLQILRDNPFGDVSSSTTVANKSKNKKKHTALDTILEHKFNALKDKLTESDWQDIMDGKITNSDSDEHTTKKRGNKKTRQQQQSNSSNDETHQQKRHDTTDSSSNERPSRKTRKSKNAASSSSSDEPKSVLPHHRKKRESSSSSDERRDTKSLHKSRKPHGNVSSSIKIATETKKQQRKRSSSSSDDRNNRKSVHKSRKRRPSVTSSVERRREARKRLESTGSSNDDSSSSVERPNVKRKPLSSKENEKRKKTSYLSCYSGQVSDDEASDSDRRTKKVKNWGLVKSDGSKIALKGKTLQKLDPPSSTNTSKLEKVVDKTSTTKKKRLTEEEKAKMLKEMMSNAAWRDKEREDKVRKYRERDKKDSNKPQDYDPDFIHKELLRSANNSSVESRIKSNLNNIQRSSRHMDQHFSKRH